MNLRAGITPEAQSLIDAACDGIADDTQLHELELLLLTDDKARKLYVHLLDLDAQLQWLVRSLQEGSAALKGVVASKQPRLQQQVPAFPAILLRNPVGYFSSGWPVAYLIATVILGVGLVIGATVHVSHPPQIVSQSLLSAENRQTESRPKMDLVGRVTGMVDCKWAKDSVPLRNNDVVVLGRELRLESGLLEIGYGTGAKVILQGRVTYQVEATNGGFLTVGKVTGKVEAEKAKGFVIRTPTATVTDLGTEFGVEVSREGVTETQVLVGAVKVAFPSKRNNDVREEVVHAGSAVCVDTKGNRLVAIRPKEPWFVRTLPPRISDTKPDAYAELVLSMQPFAYYRMEPPKDRKDRFVVLDSAPGGHHGTLHFSDQWSGEPWEAGRFGSSLLLRGPMMGDYVDVPEFPNADGNQISFSAWIYSWGIEGDRMIAGEAVPFPLRKSDTWQFAVELHPVHNLIVHVNPHNSDYALAMEGNTKPFPRAQWQHVAFVADGAMLHVYHNGVETASAPCDGVALSPSPKQFSIGAIWAWSQGETTADAKPTSFFSGRIDELAVFHRALSVQDIRQLSLGKASRSN